MKKLIFALAVSAVAGMASAASCTWQSGSLYVPKAGGGNTSTGVATASQLVNASLFLLADQTAYDALKVWTDDSKTTVDIAATTANLYSKYKAGDFGVADNTGVNKNAGGTIIGAANVTATPTYGKGDSIFGVIIYETTTADGSFYIANMANWAFSADSNKNLTNLASKFESTGAAMTGWTAAVPEPTSGLLLLLGMAGLALRRHRA